MMRIQSALDEINLFPENNNVDILDIINTIPDKNATASKEKLNGYMEISSKEVKALMNSMRREK